MLSSKATPHGSSEDCGSSKSITRRTQANQTFIRLAATLDDASKTRAVEWRFVSDALAWRLIMSRFNVGLGAAIWVVVRLLLLGATITCGSDSLGSGSGRGGSGGSGRGRRIFRWRGRCSGCGRQRGDGRQRGRRELQRYLLDPGRHRATFDLDRRDLRRHGGHLATLHRYGGLGRGRRAKRHHRRRIRSRVRHADGERQHRGRERLLPRSRLVGPGAGSGFDYQVTYDVSPEGTQSFQLNIHPAPTWASAAACATRPARPSCNWRSGKTATPPS